MEWEFKKFSIPRHESRNSVRQILVSLAEHQGWEIDRVRIHRDGKRHIVVRRKVIKVRTTV